MLARSIIVTACVITTACASTTRSRPARCELAAADSVLSRGRPLFRACSVDRAARFINNGGVRPELPRNAVRSACYSAELEFVVDATGRPETATAHVVRTNDQAFGQALLATVGSWKYEPARRSDVPVRQIVTTRQTAMTAMVVAPRGAPPSGPPRGLPPC